MIKAWYLTETRMGICSSCFGEPATYERKIVTSDPSTPVSSTLVLYIANKRYGNIISS